MQSAMPNIKTIRNTPRFLWFLILSFAMTIAMANWYEVRIIEIFGISVAPGALVFPITLLLSDVITEVYGYKQSRRAIWSAFLFNLIFVGFGQLVILLPSPDFATDNEAFDKLLSLNMRIVFASLVSYLVAESINSYIMAKIKIRLNGNYMGIRFILSTFFSALVDSFLFIFVAFYGYFSLENVLSMGFHVWLIKVFVETCLLPFSVRLAKWLKEKEELDIYDLNTNFSLFRLEAEYQPGSNLYSSR